ncbi:hypothetical protein RHS01_03649 [Rhizoctonia solani]|uniref:Uncharacterized protein n=1 Tax=Rhizoctonia solani TaxID=456999 RepID=A0A8H7IFG5_9AGAM|nr:hypothetical protein RHS01_03649 [Rhizoctonia solani]
MHLDPTTEGPSQASTHPMATIDDKDKKDPHGYFESGHSDESSRLLGEGSSSGAQPLETVPAYEEMHRDLPPEFQLYHADYETTSSGDIYSHDKHLNEDGEALYQFILSRAKVPPNFILKCRGTHPETRVRHVTRTETTDNRTVTRTEPEMHTETIVDFDFAIDISEHLRQLPPVLWTVPDDEPTYRGRMKREVLTDTMGGVVASQEEFSRLERPGRDKRKMGTAALAMPSRSELTLRQWADRYCESNKSMKSFKFRKVVYGWNTEKLTQGAIWRIYLRLNVYPFLPLTQLYGQVYKWLRTTELLLSQFQFVTSASEIDIRPSSTISRALSKTWVVVLLWLTLIYPFIWIYDRLRGGRWEVAGSAFPLHVETLRRFHSWESAEAYRRRTFKEVTGDVMSLTSERSDGTDDRILAETSNGVSQLIGPSKETGSLHGNQRSNNALLLEFKKRRRL